MSHILSIDERDADRRLKEYVEKAKRLSTFGPDFEWDENEWKRPSLPGITFCNIDKTSRKFDASLVMREPMLTFAKAYVLQKQTDRPSEVVVELYALRLLERVLTTFNIEPDIKDLDALVLDAAAELAKKRFSMAIAARAGEALEVLSDFLYGEGIVHQKISWKNPIKRPDESNRTGEKAEERRNKLLPDGRALDAIAKIFFGKELTHPRDIVTTSVVALLSCVPSHVEEILALRNDCERWEHASDGEEKYGLVFHLPAKDGDAQIKWVPKPLWDVAQEAIARVRKISTEGRRLAAWMEDCPDEIYRHAMCPNLSADVKLSCWQAAKALGIHHDNLQYIRVELRRLGLSAKDGGNTLRSIAQWAAKRLPEGFPMLDVESGLRYSQALFCLNGKMMRMDNILKSPLTLMRLTGGSIHADLETQESRQKESIFSRHKLDDDEKPLKLTSNQLRHMLNTMAQRGGMSQEQIARWSGRRTTKANGYYDHVTPLELLGKARDIGFGINAHAALAEAAKMVVSSSPKSMQHFLSLRKLAFHVTEIGFCGHAFAESPCQKFRNCLSCSEQICIKGDHRKEFLRFLVREARESLELAQAKSEQGAYGADRWVDVQRMTIEWGEQLLAILDDERVPDGSVVYVKEKRDFNPLDKALTNYERRSEALGEWSLAADGEDREDPEDDEEALDS